MSDQTTPRDQAILAAELASEATTELLRFAREGAIADTMAFEEAIEHLAEALQIAIKIERRHLTPGIFTQQYGEDGSILLDRLATDLGSFLEGWA